MPSIDPFDELGLGNQPVRRRDLREPSTRRSRRAARKRAEALRNTPALRPATGPRPGVSSRHPRTPLGKRIATRLFSIVALALAASFAVATSIPTTLFPSASATASISHSKTSTINGQGLSASTGAAVPVARDSFEALSADELNELKDGVGFTGYTVNNSGPIRWPFDFPVPLGDRFGPRIAPCRGCSTFHNGTDFETGNGAPIYAIANGTVTVSELSGSLGQHVAISHDVNGYEFTSVYGHMQAGSSPLKVGDVVTEGEIVGVTGDTGESTGPHLDFEIDINGVPVDSFVWLKAHTAH